MADITIKNQGNVSDEGLINWRAGDSSVTTGDQSIFDTSSIQLAPLGQVKVVGDRVFRYAQAGGAGNPGALAQVNVSTPLVATAANADPAGGKTITFYFATAVSANAYAEALVYFQAGTSTQRSAAYRVKSHSAVGTTANGILYLYEPLKYQVVTSDSLALIPNIYSGVTINTAGTAACPGMFVVNCTSGDYTWLQTWGPAVGTNATAAAANSPVIAGNTGAYTNVVISTANATAVLTAGIVGYSLITQTGTGTKSGPIFLQIAP